MKEFDEVRVAINEGLFWIQFDVPVHLKTINTTVAYIEINHRLVKAILFRKDGEDVAIYDVVKGNFRSNILKQTTTAIYGGEIAGFPKEVVEKMLDEQERQGNERDVSIFERNKDMDVGTGGFDWWESTDGIHFWNKVIFDKNFDTFFEKYPKSEKKVIYEAPKPKFKVGDEVKQGDYECVYNVVENIEYDYVTKQWLVRCRGINSYKEVIHYESRFDLYHDDEFSLPDFREQVTVDLMAHRGKAVSPPTKTHPDVDEAYNASIDPFSDTGMAAFGAILEKESMQLKEHRRNKLWTTDDVERWYYTAFGAKKGDNGTLILSSKSGVVEVSQDI